MPIPSMSMLQVAGGAASGGGAPLWENNFDAANGAFSDAAVTAAGGAWVIASNLLTNTTDYAAASILVGGVTYNDDQWVRYTWGVIDGYVGFLCVNATVAPSASPPGATSGYALRVDTNGSGELFRSGVSLGFMPTFGTPTAGETIELRRVDAGGGSVDLRYYVNNVLRSTINNASPLSGGYPGWGLNFRDSTAGMTTFNDASTGDSTGTWP